MLKAMQGQSSPWHDFVQSLPHTTNSPVLWSLEEQSELLQGSPALQEAQARAQALSAEWDSIKQQLEADPSQHFDSEPRTIPDRLRQHPDCPRLCTCACRCHSTHKPTVAYTALLLTNCKP